MRTRMDCHRTLCTIVCAVLVSVSSPRAARAQNPATPNLGATLVEEPRVVGKGVDFLARRFEGETGFNEKSGVYPELGNMITGSGWISAGPGLRFHLFDGYAFVDASAAISWRNYEMAQARIEFPTLVEKRLALGAQVMGQDLTQVNYFGAGPDSLRASRSEYRLRYGEALAYARFQSSHWMTFDTEFGWLGRPNVSAPSGWFDRGFPDIREVFPADPAVSLYEQPRLLRSAVGVTADTRNYVGHPTAGTLVHAQANVYSDRDGGTFSFRNYQLEAAQFVPVISDFWTVALHGLAVAADVPSGHEVPFYLQPSLGGQNSIRGYSDYRFHDRNLLLLNAESRWAVTDHIDAAVFADAGNVAARFGSLDLGHRAYGAGVRVHSTRETYARFDVGRSADEGWHAYFRISDSLHLDRVGSRTAAMPFVP